MTKVVLRCREYLITYEKLSTSAEFSQMKGDIPEEKILLLDETGLSLRIIWTQFLKEYFSHNR